MCSCTIYSSPGEFDGFFMKELCLLLENSYIFMLHPPRLLENLLRSRNLFKKVSAGKKKNRFLAKQLARCFCKNLIIKLTLRLFLRYSYNLGDFGTVIFLQILIQQDLSKAEISKKKFCCIHMESAFQREQLVLVGTTFSVIVIYLVI